MKSQSTIAALLWLVITFVIGINCTAFSQSKTNLSAIVDRLAPEFHPVRGEMRRCFASLKSPMVKGATAIVAAYVDEQQGRLRLLTRSDKTYIVGYEIEIGSLGAVSCSVELVDVDGDGTDEAKITFSSQRGELTDWILKLQGDQLISLGPTSTDRNGRLITLLSNSVFLDVKRNGTLQIIGSAPESLAEDTQHRDYRTRLYAFENGRYVPAQLLLFHQAVSTFEGGSDTQIGEFNLARDVEGPFILVVAGQAGKSKADQLRGTISVNGVEVVSHQELGDVSVGLQNLIVGTNQIAIKLDRNLEASIHQETATGMLNVLVLRDSSSN
jgi:hypothetical protein